MIHVQRVVGCTDVVVMVDLLTQHAYLSTYSHLFATAASRSTQRAAMQPMHGRAWLDESVRAAAVDSPVAVIAEAHSLFAITDRLESCEHSAHHVVPVWPSPCTCATLIRAVHE